MILDVVTEIKTVLKNHLAPELSDLGLPSPPDYFIAERDTPITGYPAVFILADTSEEISFISGPVSSMVHDQVHEIALYIVHKHTDPEVLATELFHYQHRIRRVLKNRIPQSPVQFIEDLKPLRHEYSPAALTEGGEFVKDVLLRLLCTERIKEA